MGITKDFNRQMVKVAMVEFAIADIVAGADEAAINLPEGSVIIGGDVTTLQAWNSTTSDVLDVGDSGSQNRYLNDGDFRALGARVALVPTGYVHSAVGPLTVRWTSGGGSPTTGRSRLTVQYVIKGSSESTHG